MRVSSHSNLMREQTQLQPRLYPWHLETSDLCISSRDLVLSVLSWQQWERSWANTTRDPALLEGTAQRRVKHQIRTRLLRTLVNQILEILQRQILQAKSLCSIVLLGLPNIQMEPSLLHFIATAFFSLWKSLALISQQSFPRLWKAALGTLSLLMSKVTSSALPACPQRPHTMRCAGSLHSLCSAVHWHVTAWSLPSHSNCPSSSRDSSQLRTCDRWLWRALGATQIRIRYNVTPELLSNTSPFYSGVSGSFLPAWKSQERNTLSILPSAHPHRIQEDEIGYMRLLSLNDRIRNQCLITHSDMQV